jgi:hypothetical protein
LESNDIDATFTAVVAGWCFENRCRDVSHQLLVFCRHLFFFYYLLSMSAAPVPISFSIGGSSEADKKLDMSLDDLIKKKRRSRFPKVGSLFILFESRRMHCYRTFSFICLAETVLS